MKKTKKNQQTLSPEEQQAQANQWAVKEIQEQINNGQIPAPTRVFKVGDQVKIGAIQNIFVTEVLFDGMGYAVHYDYMGKAYGSPIQIVGDDVFCWLSVLPMTSYCQGQAMHVKDDVQIRFYNTDITSLLHKVYFAGVDFNPAYQRDFVWSMEQKLSLMDSIFNNIEIGKFTFIKYDFSPERRFYYEILDGKQRLSTICEYYEDRFAWRGKKFSELCAADANHFTMFPVIQGEVGEITEQQIYKLFIKMNTSGTPVSEEHLNRIKSLIIN